MITFLMIELGIVVVVAVVIAADMATNGHPSLRD